MRRAGWFLALIWAAHSFTWAVQPARAGGPPPIEPPPFDQQWTGLYAALSIGGDWGTSSWDRTGTFDESGWLLSGSAGYNYQIHNFVIGLEGDLTWSSLSGTTTNNCPSGCETKSSFLASLRARAGYGFGRFLPYITAGPALSTLKATALGFNGLKSIQGGWVAGAGLEYALSPTWSARVEYLHYEFGKTDCGVACGTITPDRVGQNVDTITAGLEYRFGSPPPIEPPPFDTGN